MYTNTIIILIISIIITLVKVDSRVITTGSGTITEFNVGVDDLNDSNWRTGNVFVVNERQCFTRGWNFSVYSPVNQIGAGLVQLPADGTRISSHLIIQYIAGSSSGFLGGNFFYDNVVMGVYQYPQPDDSKSDQYNVPGLDYSELNFGSTAVTPSFFGNSGSGELGTYRAISFTRPYSEPCTPPCFVAYRVITYCDQYECGELNPADVASHCCDGTAQTCTYQNTIPGTSPNFTAYYTLIPKCDSVCPPAEPAPPTVEPPPLPPPEIPAPIVEAPEPPPRIWGPPIIYGIPEPAPVSGITQIPPMHPGIIVGIIALILIIIGIIIVGVCLYRRNKSSTNENEPVYVVDEGGKF